MSSPIDPKIWGKAKDAYINSTESLAALAMRFGISKRAVEKRASDEGWAALRQGQNVPVKPKPVTHPFVPPPVRRQTQRFDEVEIIESGIASLSGILSGGMEDTRGIGSIATGMCRLIELRNKLVPKTAADLADMAIALDISPEDFIRQLEESWRRERA